MIESTLILVPHPALPGGAMIPVDPQAWGRVLQTIKETLHQMQYFYLSDKQFITSLEIDHQRLGRMVRHFMLSDGVNPFLNIADFGPLDEEAE